MNKLEIKETTNTPYVLFDHESKIFKIEGKSFPEDNKEFYSPILKWLEEYKNTKPDTFELKINLYYLSSSSVISIKQILMKVSEYKNLGTKISIVWCYDEDDDDIKKTGEDYMEITKLHFEFQENE